MLQRPLLRRAIPAPLACIAPLLLTWLMAPLLARAADAPPAATLTVHVDRPGIKVSPTLYGIFFEEINRAGEGGLYGEMVQNRSFEDADRPTTGWSLVRDEDAAGSIAIDTDQPMSERNRHSLKLTIERGRVGVANDGFKGIAVKRGGQYSLSLFARADKDFRGPLLASLQNSAGWVLASAKIDGLTTGWKQFTCTLNAPAERDPAGRLVIASGSPGRVWLDLVSLFPNKTWKDRPNGLRPDLAEMIAAMRPSFFRFPGGCWVEGETMRTSYRWKETIGSLGDRVNQYDLWKYYCTNGLGFHEYLQLCEDLGAEPLFVVNCGMSHKQVVPMDELEPWVQDLLDAIEYANGPADSKWGSLRAKNGHPEPFHLKYVEVGNENGQREYDERYARFYDALKQKYPEIHIVADFWRGGTARSRPVEIIDEHYYATPEFFIENAGRYDAYDRKGPKIYVGEYASQKGAIGNGNLRAALGEAAFMTGLERNSDVVVMASYAPLLCNVHYKIWNPDAIYFDSSRVCGTPSYYVQRLFSRNRADVILPSELDFTSTTPPPQGGIGLGTWLTRAQYKDLKVTRGDKVLLADDLGSPQSLERFKSLSGDWTIQDGSLQQQAQNREGCFIVAGEPGWSDYTISLKARKLGGNEGFLIRFNSSADGSAYTMWNIGGHRNTRYEVERVQGLTTTQVGKVLPGHVENGRWYDIRIELHGRQVRCFLDGRLIQEVTYPTTYPLYAVAGRAADDVILKVVNVSPNPQDTAVRLDGAGDLEPKATATVLTSADPSDENTLESPNKVVPVTGALPVPGPSFRHTFPPNSVTVLRIGTAPRQTSSDGKR